ncbi:cation:dicarboxylase symporter family transporter [Entomospira entomophila]|uniref:Dicarboxylate/amino acid:cation symporter n=1 Tax=Entomospira entomophila TaxID=2719988 RepID=A0A968KVT9_9SPIO|nr:cation:dicarboxylase symporter family transporter [Entomospira entomophilus]NIZ40185.1 dicarboxylate/amino acid:cation symporter [Entomospira entomophilus]WDI35744.1 cation:dicarboxylase symporter family transporter [Entomospira entomophilus]
MRLWHFVLGAMILAVGIGMTLPAEVSWLEPMTWITGDLFTQYIAYLGRPLFFFSMVISVAYLKRRHVLLGVMAKSLIIGVGFSFLLALLGVFLVRMLPLPRLIILFEQNNASMLISGVDIMDRVLPNNIASIFLDFWFLPAFVLALILGLNMGFDMEAIEPTFNLFDSISRILFHIILKSFYIIFIPVFFLVLRFMHELRFNEVMSSFKPLFLTMIIASGVLFLLFSFIYYLVTKGRNPVGWFWGSGIAIGFGFLGAPSVASYSLYSVESHKNQGIKRDLAGVNVPLFMLFIRSGTAFILAMVLMLVVKSYSNLEIGFGNMINIVMGATLSSLFLPLSSGIDGFHQALLLSTSIYPGNLENGLRALDPIIPYLSQFASLIDMLTLAFFLRLFAYHHDFLRHRSYL